MWGGDIMKKYTAPKAIPVKLPAALAADAMIQ